MAINVGIVAADVMGLQVRKTGKTGAEKAWKLTRHRPKPRLQAQLWS